MSDRLDRRSFLARGAIASAGVAAIGAGGGLLSACGSGSGSGSGSTSAGGHPNGITSATPKKGGKVVMGVEAEEKGFDPTTATFDTTGIIYARTVFDPLAIISEDGSVQPYLAQSITPNKDYTAWTITVRPNVLFHDGTACDGAALKYNFDAHKKSLLTGPALTNVATITQTGPLSVQLTMHEPWVPFDQYLAGGIGAQMSWVAAPSMLKAKDGTSHPVGTGPFVFGQWVQNDHFTAHRNPHYWRSGLPYLDTIEYRPIPDPTQLVNSLMSNSVDIIHSSAPANIKQMRGDSSLAYIDDSKKVIGEPDMGCLLLNLSKPPFNDPDVRRAAAMAISSEQYTKVIDYGVNPASNAPFTKDSPYYADTYPAYDPTKAKQLVQQVAQRTGKPVSLTINQVPSPTATRLTQYLQAQLQKVGMRVSLNSIQQAQLINVALRGDFQAQTWRQFAATDPDLNYIFWSPTQIGGLFSINMARNTDPAMETALQKGRQSADHATRVAAYQQVASLMGKDIPYIWTDRTVWSIGAQPSVQNFNNPTIPGGKPAYGMITGAIWPTQIWKS